VTHDDHPLEVRHRRAARVLPVNRAGEVLLLLSGEPGRPDVRWWGSAGGGVEAGESVRAAAVRELAEETGLVVAEDALLGPVARTDVEFDWGRWHLVQDQTYFALPLDGISADQVSLAGLEPLEVGTIDRAGWWTPADLDAEGNAVDADLLSIMEVAVSVVRGAVPRVTARVMPVDDAGRVLLLRRRHPTEIGREMWGSVGGEVQPGETLVAAALRELREETGIDASPQDLTGVVHRGAHRHERDGVVHHRHSTVYALPLAGEASSVEVSLAGLEPDEVGNVRGAAWWTPDQMAEAGSGTHDDLPEIMAAAVAAARAPTTGREGHT